MTGPSQKAHDEGGLARFGLVLLLVAVALSGCDEHREYTYQTLADAVAAGETTRGWLHDWLPPSSHAIKLLYSADSPATWGAFQFSPVDMERLRQHLKPVATPSDFQQVPGAGTSWWPEFLTGRLDSAATHQRGFDLYVGGEPSLYREVFAINESKGEAFFYRNPAEGAR